MISRVDLDAFLSRCMTHYDDSLVMRCANEQARALLRRFMTDDFLPVWKERTLSRMDESGVDELDESVILEGIHARLYLEEGYSAREREIFSENDPQGYRDFLSRSAREIFQR